MLHHSYVCIFHSLCPKSGFRDAGTYRDMGTVLTNIGRWINQLLILAPKSCSYNKIRSDFHLTIHSCKVTLCYVNLNWNIWKGWVPLFLRSTISHSITQSSLISVSGIWIGFWSVQVSQTWYTLISLITVEVGINV